MKKEDIRDELTPPPPEDVCRAERAEESREEEEEDPPGVASSFKAVHTPEKPSQNKKQKNSSGKRESQTKKDDISWSNVENNSSPKTRISDSLSVAGPPLSLSFFFLSP